jgi:hypothetical protein
MCALKDILYLKLSVWSSTGHVAHRLEAHLSVPNEVTKRLNALEKTAQLCKVLLSCVHQSWVAPPQSLNLWGFRSAESINWFGFRPSRHFNPVWWVKHKVIQPRADFGKDLIWANMGWKNLRICHRSDQHVRAFWWTPASFTLCIPGDSRAGCQRLINDQILFDREANKPIQSGLCRQLWRHQDPLSSYNILLWTQSTKHS